MIASPALNVPDTDAAWQAVQVRDRGADGRFVYAVASTGIFCRPSCPSRRPRRERVQFFVTPGQATAAGYRPCRRCRPTERPAPTLALRARSLLDRDTESPPSLAELARALHTSPSHLQRSFTREVGLSPRAYVEQVRASRLRSALRAGKPVTRAIYEAGFSSPSRAYAAANRAFGMPPGRYRAGGEGLAIQWTIVPCMLGRLLVARTDQGICAVIPGDTDEACLQALDAEFPQASRSEAKPVFAEALSVRDYLDGRTAEAPPLDLQGTEFQRLVWAALAQIPRGETRTYTDVALAVGRPTAVRAVAGACAANRVAVLVPCHRVIREDGGLGGYKWGLKRKQDLLRREAAG